MPSNNNSSKQAISGNMSRSVGQVSPLSRDCTAAGFLARPATLAGLFLTCLCLLLPTAAQALDSDREKPIHVNADQVSIQEKKGISVYTGDVILTQGTLTITGDKMTVYHKNQELKKIIAVGKPATYEELPEGETEKIHARSRRMEYVATSEIFIFTQEAHLWQGTDRSISGERIEYDRINNGMQASNEGKGRVNAVFTPRKAPQDKP